MMRGVSGVGKEWCIVGKEHILWLDFHALSAWPLASQVIRALPTSAVRHLRLRPISIMDTALLRDFAASLSVRASRVPVPPLNSNRCLVLPSAFAPFSHVGKGYAPAPQAPQQGDLFWHPPPQPPPSPSPVLTLGPALLRRAAVCRPGVAAAGRSTRRRP
jgi:hypothetical protein